MLGQRETYLIYSIEMEEVCRKSIRTCHTFCSDLESERGISDQGILGIARRIQGSKL